MSQEHATPEVKPEVLFIYEIIKDVVAGKIRIPKFQRPFVWRREQMLDLLSSIYLQYPIGSLLLWETDTKLASIDWVGPVYVPSISSGLASHVLDGQQRLSTLVGALQKPRDNQPTITDLVDPERWTIWFDAKRKGFEHPKPGTTMQPWHFPLQKLMDTVEFLRECQRILGSGDPDAGKYIDIVQDLTRSFTTYKLPVIRIKNTMLTQAVDIFARLNSKGQTMSADQMVSALSYAEDEFGNPIFTLSEKIDELLSRMDDLGFGGIDRTVILRCLLASLGEDIYRSDWTRLGVEKRSELSKSLPEVVEQTGVALELAVKFLHTINVRTNRLLPYAMQLVVLGAFFLKCPSPTSAQLAFLRRWFWVSSFTARFASSNPSRDGDLVAEFRDEVSQTEEPTVLKNMRLDEAAEPFPVSFDMRSARARTLLLVLLSLDPMDEHVQKVFAPWERIAMHGPNSMSKIISTVQDKELSVSPANRILRINLENRAQAKGWLLNLNDLPFGDRDSILASHGINDEAYQMLLVGDSEGFLRSRRDHLIQIEREFMSRESVILPTDLEPKPSAIDTDE